MKHGKAIAWALLCTMLLALTGCGGGSGAGGADGEYQKVGSLTVSPRKKPMQAP